MSKQAVWDTLYTLTDDRETFGADIGLDKKILGEVAEMCSLAPEFGLEVHLVPATTEARIERRSGFEFDLMVPAEDKFSYSVKSLTRLNRILVGLVRLVAAGTMLEEFFGTGVMVKLIEDNPIISVEAYELARDICVDSPFNWPLYIIPGEEVA